MAVLLTGSAGYIGSHTLVDLCENDWEVVGLDNYSRSSPEVIKVLTSSLKKKFRQYDCDACDLDSLRRVFTENPSITAIIHLAAFKSVSESVANPLMYYRNNLISLINLLKCAAEFEVDDFVYSSSCTVYGNPTEMPVTEFSPLLEPESPYGATKQMGEQIVKDFAESRKGTSAVVLRYFNPAGAHPSGIIGESPAGPPQNLVPVITQTALGQMPPMKIFGDDYPTRDGTCIRDFIHVCDLANAHRLALEYLRKNQNRSAMEVFNLGTGLGVTVMEAVKAFEQASGVPIDFTIAPRREGDIPAIYANNDKARKLLGWDPGFSLVDIMDTAWRWEKSKR